MLHILVLSIWWITLYLVFFFLQNRMSDVPKLKGEKERKPVSLRVQDAAEGLLSVIMDRVVRHIRP